MGTWGYSSFENNAAMDLLADIEDATGVERIRGALDVVNDNDGYLDADVCQEGIAAAEIVAAMRGHPGEDVPGEAGEWVEQHRNSFDDDWLPAALRAIERIRTASELKDLWDEGDATEWHASLDDLRERLTR